MQFYVEESRAVLNEGSLMHQKAILRSFVKRVELNEKAVTIEYTMPMENEKTSGKEVLDIKQLGSPYQLISRTFRVEFVMFG